MNATGSKYTVIDQLLITNSQKVSLDALIAKVGHNPMAVLRKGNDLLVVFADNSVIILKDFYVFESSLTINDEIVVAADSAVSDLQDSNDNNDGQTSMESADNSEQVQLIEYFSEYYPADAQLDFLDFESLSNAVNTYQVVEIDSVVSDVSAETSGSVAGLFATLAAVTVGSAGTAETAATSAIVNGLIVAGPVVPDNDLVINAYSLETGELVSQVAATVDSSGNFRMEIDGFTGPAMFVLSSSGEAAPDYLDEALGVAIDLDGALAAVADVKLGEQNVSVTPLSTLAAAMLKIDILGIDKDTTQLKQLDDNGDPVAWTEPVSYEEVVAAVEKISSALGLTVDEYWGSVLPVIDDLIDVESGDITAIGAVSNKYGLVLAALSGLDVNDDVSVTAGLVSLASGIEGDADTGYVLNAESQAIILRGAIVAAEKTGISVKDIAVMLDEDVESKAESFDPATSDLSGLTPVIAALLSSETISQMSSDQISAVSADILSTLPSEGLVSWQNVNSSTPLFDLVGNKLSKMTGSQVGAIVEETGYSLTENQIVSLSSSAFGTLSVETLSSISFANVKASQLKVLSTDKVKEISLTQLQELSASQVKGLNSVQVASMTQEQFEALSVEQLIAIGSVGGLAAISAEKIVTVDPEAFGAISGLKLKSLSVEQLGALSVDQLTNLSARQLAYLEVAEVPSEFNSIVQTIIEQEVETSISSWGELKDLVAPKLSALNVLMDSHVNDSSIPDSQVATAYAHILDAVTGGAGISGITTSDLEVFGLTNVTDDELTDTLIPIVEAVVESLTTENSTATDVAKAVVVALAFYSLKATGDSPEVITTEDVADQTDFISQMISSYQVGNTVPDLVAKYTIPAVGEAGAASGSTDSGSSTGSAGGSSPGDIDLSTLVAAFADWFGSYDPNELMSGPVDITPPEGLITFENLKLFDSNALDLVSLYSTGFESAFMGSIFAPPPEYAPPGWTSPFANTSSPTLDEIKAVIAKTTSRVLEGLTELHSTATDYDVADYNTDEFYNSGANGLDNLSWQVFGQYVDSWSEESLLIALDEAFAANDWASDVSNPTYAEAKAVWDTSVSDYLALKLIDIKQDITNGGYVGVYDYEFPLEYVGLDTYSDIPSGFDWSALSADAENWSSFEDLVTAFHTALASARVDFADHLELTIDNVDLLDLGGRLENVAVLDGMSGQFVAYFLRDSSNYSDAGDIQWSEIESVISAASTEYDNVETLLKAAWLDGISDLDQMPNAELMAAYSDLFQADKYQDYINALVEFGQSPDFNYYVSQSRFDAYVFNRIVGEINSGTYTGPFNPYGGNSGGGSGGGTSGTDFNSILSDIVEDIQGNADNSIVYGNTYSNAGFENTSNVPSMGYNQEPAWIEYLGQFNWVDTANPTQEEVQTAINEYAVYKVLKAVAANKVAESLDSSTMVKKDDLVAAGIDVGNYISEWVDAALWNQYLDTVNWQDNASPTIEEVTATVENFLKFKIIDKIETTIAGFSYNYSSLGHSIYSSFGAFDTDFSTPPDIYSFGYFFLDKSAYSDTQNITWDEVIGLYNAYKPISDYLAIINEGTNIVSADWVDITPEALALLAPNAGVDAWLSNYNDLFKNVSTTWVSAINEFVRAENQNLTGLETLFVGLNELIIYDKVFDAIQDDSFLTSDLSDATLLKWLDVHANPTLTSDYVALINDNINNLKSAYTDNNNSRYYFDKALKDLVDEKSANTELSKLTAFLSDNTQEFNAEYLLVTTTGVSGSDLRNINWNSVSDYQTELSNINNYTDPANPTFDEIEDVVVRVNRAVLRVEEFNILLADLQADGDITDYSWTSTNGSANVLSLWDNVYSPYYSWNIQNVYLDHDYREAYLTAIKEFYNTNNSIEFDDIESIIDQVNTDWFIAQVKAIMAGSAAVNTINGSKLYTALNGIAYNAEEFVGMVNPGVTDVITYITTSDNYPSGFDFDAMTLSDIAALIDPAVEAFWFDKLLTGYSYRLLPDQNYYDAPDVSAFERAGVTVSNEDLPLVQSFFDGLSRLGAARPMSDLGAKTGIDTLFNSTASVSDIQGLVDLIVYVNASSDNHLNGSLDSLTQANLYYLGLWTKSLTSITTLDDIFGDNSTKSNEYKAAYLSLFKEVFDLQDFSSSSANDIALVIGDLGTQLRYVLDLNLNGTFKESTYTGSADGTASTGLDEILGLLDSQTTIQLDVQASNTYFNNNEGRLEYIFPDAATNLYYTVNNDQVSSTQTFYNHIYSGGFNNYYNGAPSANPNAFLLGLKSSLTAADGSIDYTKIDSLEDIAQAWNTYINSPVETIMPSYGSLLVEPYYGVTVNDAVVSGTPDDGGNANLRDAVTYSQDFVFEFGQQVDVNDFFAALKWDFWQGYSNTNVITDDDFTVTVSEVWDSVSQVDTVTVNVSFAAPVDNVDITDNANHMYLWLEAGSFQYDNGYYNALIQAWNADIMSTLG